MRRCCGCLVRGLRTSLGPQLAQKVRRRVLLSQDHSSSLLHLYSKHERLAKGINQKVTLLERHLRLFNELSQLEWVAGPADHPPAGLALKLAFRLASPDGTLLPSGRLKGRLAPQETAAPFLPVQPLRKTLEEVRAPGEIVRVLG